MSISPLRIPPLSLLLLLVLLSVTPWTPAPRLPSPHGGNLARSRPLLRWPLRRPVVRTYWGRGSSATAYPG
ncbi:hypothetical protein GGS23DRAFT_575129 [Durotheca rogersii]|uniref:uncharacterized protein n=1 Tax=Durotheca rogersii TaxID=419775 RepID=UPI002220FDEC|nr:uncharacterized protein GGS23DRAFT_575129 [Durotheca rogersii]KAI5861836.1 hypothetical protein GGS23DRAFT_575129 [Durotheca rogersii]